jgi:hypothetical protein
VVCSAVVLWASGADEEEVCVEVEVAASGACAGAARAFVGLALCAAGECFAWCARVAFPLVPLPFAGVLARVCVLPGKACAAIAVNIPVSVTLPASSQRLQRDSRCNAASRE